MTTLLDMEGERAFEVERHYRLLTALRLATLACILALAGFSVFDSVWEVGIWHSLLTVRTLTLAGLLIILVISFTPWALQRVDTLAVLSCLFFSAGVVMVAQMAGGGVSIYRDPLYITFIAFTLLVPWKPSAAAFCFTTVVVFYNMLYFLSGAMGYLSTWLVTNLMLCGGAVIATFSVAMIHRLRRTEFGYRRRLRILDTGALAADGLDQVFPNITRSMRDPIMLFTNPLETLLGASLPETQRQHVETARRNAVRLVRLVDEALGRAYLLANNAATVVRRVDVAALLRVWLEELQTLAEQRRVRLALEGDVTQPAWVEGDIDVLEQVLGAMLAHAVNQARSGGTARVRLVRDPGHIVITVQDNGVGRTAGDLRQLFAAPDVNEVVTARNETERRNRVALAAAKHRLQAIHGTLDAESTLGQGTTLKLMLKRYNS